MGQQTDNSTSNDSGTDSNVTNVTTPAGSSSVTPPQTSQQPASVLNPDVYDADGKKWRDRFFGREGAIKQLQQEKAELEGQLTTQIQGLREQTVQREATISQLQQEQDGLRKQVDGIPPLLEQLNQLQKQASLADKYKLMAEYPSLLSVRVEEQIPGEGEGAEPQTITVNPLLNLIENSNLDGEALGAELARLDKVYGQSPTQGDQPREKSQPPSPPSPATPSEETPEYWYNKALEIKDRMNSEGPTPELMEAHTQAWTKHSELLMKQGG